jgi:hypothetical protein
LSISKCDELCFTASCAAAVRYGEPCIIRLELDRVAYTASGVRSSDKAVLASVTNANGPLVTLHELIKALRSEAA